MEAARISAECLLGSCFIATTEHDDVAALQTIALIEFGIPGTGAFGDEVGTQASAIVGEGATNNLLHFAIVQINAGSEHKDTLEL